MFYYYLHDGFLQAIQIHLQNDTGIVTPATIVDLNGDGIDDVVVPTFKGVLLAIDGFSFKQIWNASFAASETYSMVGVGYFDEDKVPDIFVKYQYGQGYPVYEYEKVKFISFFLICCRLPYLLQIVILCGKNGTLLKELPLVPIGSESSPLTLSVEGVGNDIFLHWISYCDDKKTTPLKYNIPHCKVSFFKLI